jgi:hypothetical protein
MYTTVVSRQPCGCAITHEVQDAHGQASITYCPLHQAAGQMFEALQAVRPMLHAFRSDGSLGRRAIIAVLAAISAATREQPDPPEASV